MSKASEYAFEATLLGRKQPRWPDNKFEEPIAVVDLFGQLVIMRKTEISEVGALAFAAWIQETFGEEKTK